LFKILEYLFTDYIHWIHTRLHLDIYPQFDITLMRFIYMVSQICHKHFHV